VVGLFFFFRFSVRRSLAMGSEANVHKLLQGAADQELQSGFKRICVFCGSSSGNKSVYIDVAMELGNELVSSSTILPSSSILIFLLGTAFNNLWTQHMKYRYEQNACRKYTILWTRFGWYCSCWRFTILGNLVHECSGLDVDDVVVVRCGGR
jgi:hypothetical protein